MVLKCDECRETFHAAYARKVDSELGRGISILRCPFCDCGDLTIVKEPVC